MGIPEEELKAVFDKFVQSSKTKTGAEARGWGCICQEIIHAHGEGFGRKIIRVG